MQFIMIIYSFPPAPPRFSPTALQTQIYSLKTKQTTLSLVCVGWLLLGVWPALDCDQYTKFCSIKDNWLSFT